jgi:N-hydroxyarylamine O-acetyltransferase
VPQLPSDYELGNWFTSTSPQAPFPTTLIMERLTPDRRYKLMNRRFVTEAREGEVTSERMIETAGELEQILTDIFGIIPPVPAADILAVLAV